MASSLGRVGSSIGLPAIPVNNNAGDAPAIPNAQAVAQQALANNQPPQGQNLLPQVNNIGDQVNAQGDEQDPNQPSPVMMIASMVMKYALPALLVIGGFVAVGAALTVAGTTAAIATPFLLLAGGAIFVTIGGCLGTKVFVNDYSKDKHIRDLNEALQQEKEKKNANISSVDALKKETRKLGEKIKEKKSRINELTGLRNGGTLLNEQQRKELERLEKEVKELSVERKKKKKCLEVLEAPTANPAVPAPAPAGNRAAPAPVGHFALPVGKA